MTILETLTRLTTGYYNSNAFDAAENPGGFAADGHQENFPAALVDVGDAAAYAGAAATEAGERNDDAETARDKAQAWAEAPEDTEVEPGQFSALHHRLKTVALNDNVIQLKSDVETLVDKADDFANEAEDVEVEAGKYSSWHWSEKARLFSEAAEDIRDSLVNVVELKGSFDASTGVFPAAPDVGDYWIVTVSGTVDAIELIQGDEIIYGPSGWIIVGRVLSAAQILTLLLSVDGAGSGLDADLLDGQHGAYYRDAANMNAGVLPAARFTDATHGNRAGGALHADATGATAGFMSAADKTALDAMPAALAAKAATATTISAGAGLTGGGSLAANRTLSIATNSNGYGVRTVSTSDPSGGANGDIWLKV